MASRTLGVHGKDRAAIVPVSASDAKTNVAGLMFLAERGPETIMELYNSPDFAKIYGGYVRGFYGRYSAEGFFANLSGQEGVLLCRRYVADDAVVASKQVLNGDESNCFKVKAGYLGMPDKGSHGNNLRFKVTHSNKVATELSDVVASGAESIKVSSAVSFNVGDIIEIAEGVDKEYKSITGKDEALGTLTISPAIVKAGGFTAAATVKTLNFDLAVYRKTSSGVLELKENWTYLSVVSTSPDYFALRINNKYRGSGEIIVVDDGAELVSTYDNLLPVESSAKEVLASGSNGTDPESADWNDLLEEFDEYTDLRHLANCESTSKSVNDEGEIYCKNRGDVIWYTNLQGNMAYAESLALANQYVVSNDAYRMNNDGWLWVSDPIGIGIDPIVAVPNVGFIMGHAIYWIAKHGYQRVPAGIQEPIKGCVGVYRENGLGKQITLTDPQRTKLADAGFNIIQFVAGSGVCLRNARMGSTNKAYMWYNQIFMRIYYKVTFVQSFTILENAESGEALLNAMFNAVREYMLSDFKGNTRTAKKCAFLKVQGSTFDDVVTIICDSSNNELQNVLAGQVNIDIYFTPPPPAESIEIGVGISLQIQLKAA